MHLTRIFNEYGLFRHMSGWKHKYAEERNTNTHLINEFLFRASSAYLNIDRMNKLSVECVFQYRRQKFRLKLNNQRVLFWSPTVIEILSEMSPFLSTLRILQNKFLKLVAEESNSGIGVPKSLSDAMKKGLDTYGFTEELSKLFLNYWDKSGEQIKNYRDMDQHYYSMIKHSYIRTSPEENLLIFLPDNPEKKSATTVTFEKEIDALTYLNDSFFRFHDFVEETASLLGFKAMDIDNIDVEGQFNISKDNGNSTIALVVLDEETGRSFEFWIRRQHEKTFLNGIHHDSISLRPYIQS
jgi:hypothetical protein